MAPGGINVYVGSSSLPGGGNIATSPASSVIVPSPSGVGDITFTFNTTYQVGQFPNGDYFALPASPGGTVTVSAMTPTYTTGRHGYMVNPKAPAWNAGNSFDDRGSEDSAFSAPTALPLALTAGKSLIKVASMATQSSYSWIDHAAVLTILDTAPPVGTMRPAAFGTDKTLFSSSNITSSLFPNYTTTGITGPLSYSTASARCAPFRCAWHPGPVWGYYRSSAAAVPAGKTWGGDFMQADIELLVSLCLSHLTGPQKVDLAIKFAQHGIDTWGISVPATGGGAGFLRGGGANGAGHMIQIAFAAWALNSSTLKSWLSGASDATWDPVGFADLGGGEYMYWETALFYRSSVTSTALWGKVWETWIGDGETQYWSDFNYRPDGSTGGGVFNATLRDPYERIDGGPMPGDSYQSTASHQIMGLSCLFDVLTGFKAVWPTIVDNANVIDDYGHRWFHTGIWTQPDPAAPKKSGGTYGSTYGPATTGGSNGYVGTGVNGYIADTDNSDGTGRVPTLHGTGARSGNRFSQLTDDFCGQHIT